VDTGQRIKLFSSSERRVTLVAFSPDGKFLVLSVFHPDQIIVRRVKGSNEVGRLPCQEHEEVRSLAFPPHGTLLASGDSRQVTLWDISTQKVKKRLGDESLGCASALAFSPDGKLLAVSGMERHSISLWEVATGKKYRPFKGQDRAISSVLFSPDAK